ncbi:hypothetical protein Syun_022865 [Stephania yunnanensis]|uniref:Galactokinase N-terminal domain-containing protein n=1 Tax=Stephania yunnanensis TaxID=152371 RepID=A0AAP0FM02_9MAGN
MSGKCAKEVKVVISPYGICPLGAHIDHQIMVGIVTGIWAINDTNSHSIEEPVTY